MSTSPYIALVLQGGGALGAYQVGVFRALHEAGFTPNWVTGISIGAVNAALIAGNPPERQLERLEQFWTEITRPSLMGELVPAFLLPWYNNLSVVQALMFGQPNFSRPHLLNPYLAPAGSAQATSFYDNTPMHETLARLADFDYINSGAVRLSLGVTRVRTGELLFFDNVRREHGAMTPGHVIASTAIPPMFPGIRIDGELYWDGGCVANTPLTPVLKDQEQHPTRDMLIFLVDLWSLAGVEPQTMDEVLWRQNEIRFGSRTMLHRDRAIERAHLLRTVSAAARLLSPEQRQSVVGGDERLQQTYGSFEIVHVTYKPRADQGSSSYVDFSRRSVTERSNDGYLDMKLALERGPWRARLQAADVLGAAEEPVGRVGLYEVGGGQMTSRGPGEVDV